MLDNGASKVRKSWRSRRKKEGTYTAPTTVPCSVAAGVSVKKRPGKAASELKVRVKKSTRRTLRLLVSSTRDHVHSQARQVLAQDLTRRQIGPSNPSRDADRDDLHPIHIRSHKRSDENVLPYVTLASEDAVVSESRGGCNAGEAQLVR